MKYMIRETYTAQRGKVPENLEILKIVIDWMKSMGIADHKLYVDISGRMDTFYHQYEVDSLDQYFDAERGFYVEPDAETKRLIEQINSLTLAGNREIFEVLI